MNYYRFMFWTPHCVAPNHCTAAAQRLLTWISLFDSGTLSCQLFHCFPFSDELFLKFKLIGLLELMNTLVISNYLHWKTSSGFAKLRNTHALSWNTQLWKRLLLVDLQKQPHCFSLFHCYGCKQMWNKLQLFLWVLELYNARYGFANWRNKLRILYQ